MSPFGAGIDHISGGWSPYAEGSPRILPVRRYNCIRQPTLSKSLPPPRAWIAYLSACLLN